MIPPELELADGYPTGPGRLVLVGPPGTGKTSAALERWLVPALRYYPPSQVLAISFSRAAAGELRARLSDALGGEPGRYATCARTIHSEAWRLLRESGGDYGLRVGRGTEEDLPEESLDSATASERRAVALQIYDLARQRRDADLRAAYRLTNPVGVGLAEIEAELARYRREQAAASGRSGAAILDYTGVLEEALALKAPARKLLLLDEAQDCSLLQWELIERWAERAERVVMIGDPDQAVHTWAGAAPQRLLEHARGEIYEVRRLGRSHRVPVAAHRLAVPLIRVRPGRLAVPYEPADRAGSAVEAERREAITKVKATAQAGRTVFVLARSRAVLRRWARALADEAVAFRNERGDGPLEVPARVAAARALVDLRAGAGPVRGDLRTLLEVLPGGAEAEAMRSLSLRDGLVRLRLGRTAAHRQRWASDLARLVDADGPDVLTAPPLVTLTTAHACKGREAELVVIDLEAPRLVLRSLPGALQAERQLLYVALTRARGDLVLVRHARRDLGRVLGLRPVVRMPMVVGRGP